MNCYYYIKGSVVYNKKNKSSKAELFSFSGRSGGIRTHGPHTPSVVRYQAALHSDGHTYKGSVDFIQEKSTRDDSWIQ